jgi:hypothetical protein
MKRKRFTPEQVIRIIKESEIGMKNLDIYRKGLIMGQGATLIMKKNLRMLLQ